MSIEPFKPWLSFSEQVSLLESRGMIIRDRAQAEFYLEQIGYYRLSGYSYPFRQHNTQNQRSDTFVTGTDFQHIINLYHFDNQIKLLALEAIQHIEISMRVQISYVLGQQNPVAHRNSQYFHSKFDMANWENKYQYLLNRFLEQERREEQKTNKKGFVSHNLDKYGDLPIWVACELWDFGTLSKLFSGLLPCYRRQISSKYHLSENQLATYLWAFNFVRNVAAHHSRLWNHNVIGRPILKGLQHPQWKKLNNKKIFPIFCLMQWMLKTICPKNNWGQRFQATLLLFPQTNAAPNNEVSWTEFGIPETLDLAEWNLWQ